MNNDDRNSEFGIPEGYFSSLQEELLKNVELLEDEKLIADSCGTNDGFNVPNGYFENLRQDITNHSSSKKKKPISLYKTIKWVSGMAACFIAVFLLTTNWDTPQTKEQSFEELLANTQLTEEHISYLEYDELAEIIDATTYYRTEANLLEVNSLDFIFEDDDFIEEIAEDLLEL